MYHFMKNGCRHDKVIGFTNAVIRILLLEFSTQIPADEYLIAVSLKSRAITAIGTLNGYVYCRWKAIVRKR